MGGSVRKDFRCDPSTGEQVWRGTWLYVLDLPVGLDGCRRQERRRGFATKTAAVAAMEEAKARARGGVLGAPAGPARSAAGGGSPMLAE